MERCVHSIAACPVSGRPPPPASPGTPPTARGRADKDETRRFESVLDRIEPAMSHTTTSAAKTASAVPRPGRPRSAEAHRAILDAAAALFIEEGFDAMSVEG